MKLLIGVICASAAFASQAYVSLAGAGGSISVFNASGGSALETFATPAGAVDLLRNAAGTALYVGTTNSSENDVRGGSPPLIAVLNPATGALLHEFQMPASIVKMVLDAAGDHIYATGTTTKGTVVVVSLNLKSGATAAAAVPKATPFNLYPIAISPDGASLYVPVASQINVFAAATLATRATIALPQNGIAASPAVTPDGATLLAAGGGSVYAVDLTAKTLKRRSLSPTRRPPSALRSHRTGQPSTSAPEP